MEKQFTDFGLLHYKKLTELSFYTDSKVEYMNRLLIIGLLFGLTACSDSKQKEATVNRDSGLLPLSENPEKVTNIKTKGKYSLSNTDTTKESKKESNRKNNGPVTYNPSNFSTSYSEFNNLSYSHGDYTVHKNDSLMKIAFEVYGDYEQWRAIKDSNPEKVDSENIIKEGITLTLPEPAEKFIQNKNGDPYLIKRGDTLTSIAKNTYGSSRHWKAIWKNNALLIKDPNKIFAGFTIYLPTISHSSPYHSIYD
ncbi:LysM peptidoglycan-binding domain-containing protein [Endozoicomonas sp. SCSIO W0465]|uniref:LysM peptidoglycan-binding domain-containing protein n=1 Tax=Endozoicomonas sp. SCSIO W0465 TaxID=2918516 RepID=UPI0020753E97|nr:LysM peptidoglycan-binding domain-containing protein [Endozoicomonas sp. SCSIO W0465]USE34738.1 LysM peptidoglycan-binding domain-containing protein [Endozoicomonas sp. SCSIO W0465]